MINDPIPEKEGVYPTMSRHLPIPERTKPGCPRCGIGTPIFTDSCIVCCTVNDSIASLIKELLAQKLAAEAALSEATRKLEMLPADWQTDSSLETWFPFTAEIVKRQQAAIGAYEQQQNQQAATLLVDIPYPIEGFWQTQILTKGGGEVFAIAAGKTANQSLSRAVSIVRGLERR